jgi:CRISPR-associated protein Cas1
MKKLLNTLFVTTQGAYLSKDGETVCVRVNNENRLRVPIHTLGGIVCFGQVGCSPFLLGHCADNGVAVSFLTDNGRFLARVQGPVSGNVLLRREQYRRADDPAASAGLARAVLTAKIANSRNVLMRAGRDHGEKADAAALEEACGSLARILVRVEKAATLDDLRGLEGDAARTYFSAFNHCITTDKESFFFHERSRRPPLDNINALLSFLYTLLAHDVAAALEGVGLDPAVGFLHRDRPGRPSLALDIMEEFRPVLADRLALTLVNRRQINSKGFQKMESGAVMMSEETRKKVIIAWQMRKQEEIRHPFLEESAPVGLLTHLQAMLLARHLRGDLDGYPPFIWR